MKIDSDADRLLFLRYALPCASTLVERGNVTRQYIDQLIDEVSRNEAPKGDPEAMFKVANVMCDSVAEKMHKSSTDADVIRRYFLFEHAKVVDDRFKLMKDFNPIDCRTYSGVVIDVSAGHAVVETVVGKKAYRIDFVKDIRKNDNVVVHFDFVVEKLSSDVADKKRVLDENEKVGEKR